MAGAFCNFGFPIYHTMKTTNLTSLLGALAVLLATCACSKEDKIDRRALVERNDPHVVELNPLHSLNLGNGAFTLTLDATGLQTFPEFYSKGLSLGTYSQWAWHSFPNTEGYTVEETLEDHPLPGHPHGVYAVQEGFAQGERSQVAAEWLRANPHRLHLGNVGFGGLTPEDITDVDQRLDMWNGELLSHFTCGGTPVSVRTVSGGEGLDCLAASVESEKPLPIVLRFPYPSGVHTDDASDWNSDEKHSTEVVSERDGLVILRRQVDSSIYYVKLSWTGKAAFSPDAEAHNNFTLTPAQGTWSFSVVFSEGLPSEETLSFAQAQKSARGLWNGYWKTTGIVDFSECTAENAALIERKVVLSQYLMRVQEAQDFPPAETGMTYNSWYGKFHLEMVMWHSFHWATWGHSDLLERQLRWFRDVAMPGAREIAQRQGLPGVRWMKMTDPTAMEAPSDIGSFIVWQQPHPIYMAELVYRANPSGRVLRDYAEIVEQTAQFMAAFVSYDAQKDRYFIEGACAANESLNEERTVNPSFELAYWYFGLNTAQKWRERQGLERNEEWDRILTKLSPLSLSPDGIYLAAEKGPGVPDFESMTVTASAPAAPAGGYNNGKRPKVGDVIVAKGSTSGTSQKPQGRDPFYLRGTSSENLLAYGMLPMSPLVREENLHKTIDRAAENWGWKGGSWSWNYPTFIMNATRLGRSDVAVRAAAMDGRSELLLPSGNNYRSETLRMYLPGNGGLLLAVGLMCAGWDGCEEQNPGFPKDGTWNVRWEGITPMP